MRILILYDCLYPYTIGGAERWYRSVAERLAQRHRVTYATRRQWRHDETPDAPAGVRVVAVCADSPLYARSGRRTITAPLRFGWGVLRHLRRHRRDYDVVHLCSFPYFSLLAARLACARGGPPLVVDWLEIWSRRYWRDYLGTIGGSIGAAVQRLCVRLTTDAIVLSDLQAARLLKEGYRGELVTLKGLYTGPIASSETPAPREPLVVYVGRHIPEKRVAAIPAAIAVARRKIPALRAIIFGDGPERAHVIAEIERLGLQDAIRCPGFVPWDEIDAALRQATCLLLPSRREGYGLAVVEAAARGTPVIVTRDPDNAAIELVDPDENGRVAESAEPDVLAAAIAAINTAGPALRERTRAWFARNAHSLTIDASIAQLESLYSEITRAARR